MFKHLNTFAIGGLENVGYAANSDHLIVLSSVGRGIFDCLTRQKIFRDNGNWWHDYDEESCIIKGFGTETGQQIKVCGLFGEEKLPVRTADGWELIVSEPVQDAPPFEKYVVQNVFLKHPANDSAIFITKDGPCEIRSFGFSETGKSFIVALSCELIIWTENS